MQHGDEPELPEHHSRSTDGSHRARRSGATFPANNLDRDRNNYFAQAPFTFDRQQIDSRFDYNVNSKFNMSGTFGMLHYRANVPTVFGDAAVGRPIGGSSNPGTGHGNTYRVTVMGTYIFSPTFFMDAHYGYARQGTKSEQPGLGQNIGLDVLGIPGTNGTRAFESGWPTFIDGGGLRDHRGQRELHAVLPARPAVAIRGELQLDQDDAQHPVRQRHLRHGAEPGAGGVHHRRLRRAGRIRVRSRHHGTMRGGECRDGNCQQTSGGSCYNSAAAFLIGQGSSAGRTLQVPDVYHLNAWLYSGYVRDRWTATDKLTIDYGTRWEYFPCPPVPIEGSSSTMSHGQRAAVRCRLRPQETAASRAARRVSDRASEWPIASTDKWVVRAGYGLTNDPYEGMELIRANYPILIQVKLESPDGLTPAPACRRGSRPSRRPPKATASWTSRVTTPGKATRRTWTAGYIQSWNLTVQRELPWHFTGQIGYVATRPTRQLGLVDINAGQVIGAGDEGRPLRDTVRQNRVDGVAPAGRQRPLRLDAGATAAALRRRPEPRT